MDQLITKPLKRLLSNSKDYAKRRMNEIHNSEYTEYLALYKKEFRMSNILSPQRHVSNASELNSNGRESADNRSKVARAAAQPESPKHNSAELVKIRISEAPVLRTVAHENGREPIANAQDEEANSACKPFTRGASHADEPKATVIKVKISVSKENKQNGDNINVALDENESGQPDECIFEENKSRPLSPIVCDNEYLRRFENLVDFHEQRSKPKPIMGKSALLSKLNEPASKRSDSEIVSSLVHDRFIVNCYQSRSFKRCGQRPNRFGRTYRSLERTLNSAPEPKNVTVTQSSPIKLSDQLTSIRTSEKCSLRPEVGIEDRELHSTREDSSRVDPKIEEGANCEQISSDCAVEIPEIKIQEASVQMSSENLSDGSNGNTMEMHSDHTSLQSEIMPSDKSPTRDPQTEKTKGSEGLESTNATDGSYDMDDFLKRALGDEIHNYSSFNKTNSEEKSEQIAQKSILMEESMCTSDASDLVSKMSSLHSNFYRSVTKKLWKMGNSFKNSSVPNEEQERTADDLVSLFPNNEVVTELIRLAAVQYEAMKQISKALAVCKSTKEFFGSFEQVEGERLLLVATLKRKIILDEIRRLDYQLDDERPAGSSETGTVEVSNVCFAPKPGASEPHGNRREHRQWFVCVLHCGLQVCATGATRAHPDGGVEFTEQIAFEDLPSDFAVAVEVYSLLQPRGSRNYSHESKFHLNDVKRSRCPTPKRLLQKDKLTQVIPSRYDSGIRTPSFKLCGSMQLRVSDLSKRGPWQLQNVALCSPLTGTVAFRLRSSVRVPVRHSGFLNVGTETGSYTVWNRRWCVLDGPRFSYWNYPCTADSDGDVDCDGDADTDTEADADAPLGRVDLRGCVNARVELADRTICARPRTLLLEIARTSEGQSCTTPRHPHNIERLLLSSDTLSEMNTWRINLNTIVFALRTWNVSHIY